LRCGHGALRDLIPRLPNVLWSCVDYPEKELFLSLTIIVIRYPVPRTVFKLYDGGRDMRRRFETVLRHLIGNEGDVTPLAGMDISGQFRPGDETVTGVSRNLNSAFLILLSGETHHLYSRAAEYLESHRDHPVWGAAVAFYKEGLGLIQSEIAKECYDDEDFEESLNLLFQCLEDQDCRSERLDTIDRIYRVFFPEGVGVSRERHEKIKQLRKERMVKISSMNPDPIRNPAREILFTSNILITVPSSTKSVDELPVSDSIKETLKYVLQESQKYWYDHPIQIGVETEHNELIYGLSELDNALRFEIERGMLDENERIKCVMSVSVTHEGIQTMVKEYIEGEFRKGKPIRHIDLYVFTETDTLRMLDEVLVPAARKYIGTEDISLLYQIIGVDGEYGRHYSFLKAVSAFWQVLIDPEIKGTFKIDLDQVFPQKELVAETGCSALEHFATPLWGAEGIDSRGNRVELGMIAGALVNERDIGRSLYTPDVDFPPEEVRGDQLIFQSPLLQALSTYAEMMTRYTEAELDGEKYCIQRIHVTGGTNGILVESLRRYRPFTPTFIGRAEDQAYILSVLCIDQKKNLRYVHKDGLIMRHDKEAFASEAIKAASLGKIIGDYIRILMFTFYARSLPWDLGDIKGIIDPFTGCFVSRIPFTVVYLRLALRAALFFSNGDKESDQQGFEFLQLGIKRIHETVKELNREPNPLKERFERERKGWDLYYEILDRLEEGIERADPFAVDLKQKAMALVDDCKVSFDR
jgi:hypothetical protein